jgi:hypothetical protein
MQVAWPVRRERGKGMVGTVRIHPCTDDRLGIGVCAVATQQLARNNRTIVTKPKGLTSCTRFLCNSRMTQCWPAQELPYNPLLHIFCVFGVPFSPHGTQRPPHADPTRISRPLLHLQAPRSANSTTGRQDNYQLRHGLRSYAKKACDAPNKTVDCSPNTQTAGSLQKTCN